MKRIRCKVIAFILIMSLTTTFLFGFNFTFADTDAINSGVINDGTYALLNKSTGKYLSIYDDSPDPGVRIVQYNFGTVPSTDATRSGLFKFKHQGNNLYIIRTVRNNANTFKKISDSVVKTASVDPIDSNVNDSLLKWNVVDAGGGYFYLKVNGEDKYLCAPASGSNCETRSLSYAGDRAKWYLYQYNGTTISGCKANYSGNHILDSGSSCSLASSMFSWEYFYTTDVSVNTPGSITNRFVSSPTGAYSYVANISNSTLTGVSNKAGMVAVRVNYQNCVSDPVYFYFKPTSGEYFFLQNIQGGTGYVQSDGTTASKNSFDYGNVQIWKREYVSSGFYYIRNMDGKYLTSPSSSTSGAAITLQSNLMTGTSLERQKWYFGTALSGSGSITIKSANHYNDNLYLKINSSGQLVQGAYVNDIYFYDEFDLTKLGSDVVYLRTFDKPHYDPIDPSDFLDTMFGVYDNIMLLHTPIQLGQYSTGTNDNVGTAIDLLSNSKVMIFNGEGSATDITIDDPSQEKLYNTDIYNSSIVSNYLSGVDIVIFAGSNTAGTVSGEYNLPKSAELAGAKVAIGWKTEQSDNYMNEWIDHFFGLMNLIDSETGNYYTAENALNETNRYFSGTDAAQAKVYGNNTSLQFDDIYRR